MDGENNGKPYEQMDDLGGKPTIFGNIHIPSTTRGGMSLWLPPLRRARNAAESRVPTMPVVLLRRRRRRRGGRVAGWGG